MSASSIYLILTKIYFFLHKNMRNSQIVQPDNCSCVSNPAYLIAYKYSFLSNVQNLTYTCCISFNRVRARSHGPPKFRFFQSIFLSTGAQVNLSVEPRET